MSAERRQDSSGCHRTTSVTHKKSDNSTISSESYSWNSASNLTSKTVDSLTTTFTYDDADQLLTEARTGYSASYTYDANGNRATKVMGGVMDTYTNDDGDKLTQVVRGGVTIKSFGYDAAGRTTSVVTSAGTTTLSYDYESRVTGITYPNSSTNSFTYNGLDTRVGKTDSAGSTTFKRDGAYVTGPVLSDSSAEFTPGISERRSGASKFYGSDYLGTNSLVTNSSQATTDTKQYDAFGMLTSSTGSTPTPFGFAGGWGYQEDADSGLKLLGHRYYDSSTGRFLTRDKAMDGRNWFVYASSSPNSVIDPSGLADILIVIMDLNSSVKKSADEKDFYRDIGEIVKNYPEDSSIKVVKAKSRRHFISLLSDATVDVVFIFGHGNDQGGMPLGDPRERVNIDDEAWNEIVRRRAGTKMEFLGIRACYQGKGSERLNTLKRISSSGYAFGGYSYIGAGGVRGASEW